MVSNIDVSDSSECLGSIEYDGDDSDQSRRKISGLVFGDYCTPAD